MTTPSSNNVLLGRGVLYFDRFTKTGQPTGERHLGNMDTFTINTEDEVKQLYESMTAAAGLYKEVTIKRTVTGAAKGYELDPENVSLQLMGDLGSLVQTTGTVVDLTLTPSSKKGRYYSVEKRNISAVVVKEGSTTYVLGVDYAVDAKTGRVKVLSGGSIEDGSALTVSCSYAATTLQTVEGATAGTVEGRLRFVGDPTCGPAVEVEVFRVKVTPNGELGFLSDDWGTLSLKFSVLTDSSRPAGESPYYRVTYLDPVA